MGFRGQFFSGLVWVLVMAVCWPVVWAWYSLCKGKSEIHKHLLCAVVACSDASFGLCGVEDWSSP